MCAASVRHRTEAPIARGYDVRLAACAAGSPMMKSPRIDRVAEADLFVAELFGESEAGEAELPGGGFRGSEPFFGDAPHQCWQVVARVADGTFSGLRGDDLIVQRAGDQGSRSWRCVPAADLDPQSIVRRGFHLRGDVAVLRRVRRRRIPVLDESDTEAPAEIVEVQGFFGPNNVRRTEAQIRDAVVARATAEWTAWHSAAGAPRPEGQAAMFGRLVGYYLAAVGRIKPDTLIALQAAALGANYTALLAAGATVPAIDAEAARLAGVLLAGVPGETDVGVRGILADEIRHAREAHANQGDFKSWSAAFVVGCVRGASIAQGLEAVIGADRRHVGRSELLLASLKHAVYTAEARQRRAATTPRRRGTYHAFEPRDRAPQPGDIIVQDRRLRLASTAQVVTLAAVAEGIETHGDIVVDVQPTFVATIGGNLGDSSRKRRYPVDAQGLLVVDRRQLFVQETDTGALPALPFQSALPLHSNSTARVFALLAPVEESAAVPGQPYGGGVLT